MAKLNKSLVTLARQAGGSFKTVADRMKIADRFADRLLKINIQIRDASHLKTSHIALYVKSRLAENISKRSLQNEMASIRAVLRMAGKTFMANPAHEKLSNDALGISGESRDGTKVAIPDEIYESVLAKVREADPGAGAAMELSRHLGLRTEEAIQSVKSLKTWQKVILNEQEKVRVVFGTKGGRPRDTTILDRKVLGSVINNAISPSIVTVISLGMLVLWENTHLIAYDMPILEMQPHFILKKDLVRKRPRLWCQWIWDMEMGVVIMSHAYITKWIVMYKYL
jgi:hypothetical protein